MSASLLSERYDVIELLRRPENEPLASDILSNLHPLKNILVRNGRFRAFLKFIYVENIKEF
jgi:hypothetical protein